MDGKTCVRGDFDWRPTTDEQRRLAREAVPLACDAVGLDRVGVQRLRRRNRLHRRHLAVFVVIRLSRASRAECAAALGISPSAAETSCRWIIEHYGRAPTVFEHFAALAAEDPATARRIADIIIDCTQGHTPCLSPSD